MVSHSKLSHALVQGDKLDSRELSCLTGCQDRYLEARAHVQETLMKRQEQQQGGLM